MKVNFSIEEVIVQDFEIDVPDTIAKEDICEYIKDLYYKSEIIVEDPEVQDMSVIIHGV